MSFSFQSCKSTICRHKPSQHWRDQLGWIDCLASLARQGLGVSDEITVHRSGQFQAQFDRFFIRERSDFELCHVLFSVGFEHQVAIDDDTNWEAGSYRQRWLNT